MQETIIALEKWYWHSESPEALVTLEAHRRSREKIENEFISRVDYTGLSEMLSNLNIASYESR